MGFWDIVSFLEANWWAVRDVDDEVAIELKDPGVAPVAVDDLVGCDFHSVPPRSIVGEWVSEVNTDCLVQEKLGKIPPSSMERYSSAVQVVRP